MEEITYNLAVPAEQGETIQVEHTFSDSSHTDLAHELHMDVLRLKTKIDMLEDRRSIENSYVSAEEFEPIKKVVFGVITVVMIGVVGALISLVVGK